MVSDKYENIKVDEKDKKNEEGEKSSRSRPCDFGYTFAKPVSKLVDFVKLTVLVNILGGVLSWVE